MNTEDWEEDYYKVLKKRVKYLMPRKLLEAIKKSEKINQRALQISQSLGQTNDPVTLIDLKKTNHNIMEKTGIIIGPNLTDGVILTDGVYKWFVAC